MLLVAAIAFRNSLFPVNGRAKEALTKWPEDGVAPIGYAGGGRRGAVATPTDRALYRLGLKLAKGNRAAQAG